MPAARDAASGAPVSGSQAKTRVEGLSEASALAIPVVNPPPPHGIKHGVDLVELLDQLEADRAVAGHDRVVEHRVDEVPSTPG